MKTSAEHGPGSNDEKAFGDLLRQAQNDGFTSKETETLWNRLGALVGPPTGGGGTSAGGGSTGAAASIWTAKTVVLMAIAGSAVVAGGLATTGSARQSAPRDTGSLTAAGSTTGTKEAFAQPPIGSNGPAAHGDGPPNAIVPPAPGSAPASAPDHTDSARSAEKVASRSTLPAQPGASWTDRRALTPMSGPEPRPAEVSALHPPGLRRVAPTTTQPQVGGSGFDVLSVQRAESAEAPSVPSTSPAATPSEPVRNEGALLLRARRDLSAKPQETLSLTEEHARLFPTGTLVPEREVLAIEALVQLGRLDAARARFSDFRARFPHSPHLTRLETIVTRGFE